MDFLGFCSPSSLQSPPSICIRSHGKGYAFHLQVDPRLTNQSAARPARYEGTVIEVENEHRERHVTLPWIRGLVCGHGLLIERSELGNEQFQSPYAFPLSSKRSGSLYVWASGGLGIYQGRRLPPSLSFLVPLSFTLRFSFLFLPFSQNSSTVSIPSQAESSRATPTLPASLRRKSLVPAHRLKRLNPFFFSFSKFYRFIVP